MDYEKRQLKVPYKAPGAFTSTYGVQFQNSQGKNLIGAPLNADGSMNLDGLNEKNGSPKKRGDEDLANPFIGSSSYK